MQIDFAKLRRLAKAASPGPWCWVLGDEFCGWYRLKSADQVILDDGSACGEYNPKIEPDSENGIYISAFDPSTVLVLLNHIDQLEDQIEKLKMQIKLPNDGRKRVALTEKDIANYLDKHTTMHRRCCNDAAAGMMKIFGEETHE